VDGSGWSSSNSTPGPGAKMRRAHQERGLVKNKKLDGTERFYRKKGDIGSRTTPKKGQLTYPGQFLLTPQPVFWGQKNPMKWTGEKKRSCLKPILLRERKRHLHWGGGRHFKSHENSKKKKENKKYEGRMKVTLN